MFGVDSHEATRGDDSPSPVFVIDERPLAEPQSSQELVFQVLAPDTSVDVTDTSSASPQPGIHMGRTLGQILVILVVLLALVNIPFRNLGAGLAQLIPDRAAVVLVEGMLLKGSGPEVYRLEGHKLRLISGQEPWNSYFHDQQVTVVEDSLLQGLGKGRPIRRLVGCQDSPDVYALEDGRKRRVADPPPGDRAKPWDQVRQVPCGYLSQLPEGPPISEDTGPLP